MIRLKPTKPIKRVVPISSKALRKVSEVEVTLSVTGEGAMVTLRPLRSKQSFDVFLDDVFDQAVWREAKRVAKARV